MRKVLHFSGLFRDLSLFHFYEVSREALPSFLLLSSGKTDLLETSKQKHEKICFRLIFSAPRITTTAAMFSLQC